MYQTFSQPAPIIFGRGAISILGEKIKELGCRKVLLVCEKGVEGAGIIAKAAKSLDAAGINYATFNGVISDPTDSVVDEGGKVALEAGIDCLVGIGGGSSMDTAKAISILMTNPGPARKYIQAMPMFIDTKTPVVLVPTTAGTGSECTTVSIISLPDLNVKWSTFVNTSLAILDPELTLTLPKSETANTGMDALAHAAEAMTSANWNHHSDLFAGAAIRKISDNLLTCYNEPGNIDARSEMLLASNWAGLAFNNPITHIGHSIADAFSCNFHTPHGLGCALVLPEAMALVAPAVPDRLRVIADAMRLPLAGGETGEQLGRLVADGLRSLMRSLKIPSLRTLGHTREQVLSFVPDVVANHLSHFCPVEVTEDVARDTLASVYDTYQ
ncbi:MAG: iron-containing alcohol dehydrogenase [Oscillospiraceae bacterium]|nr:iron-containing alcohol dehydrogenase [Oscillospiraceae bacterium]